VERYLAEGGLGETDLWVLSVAERERLGKLAQGFGLTPVQMIDRLLRRLLYAMPSWAGRPVYEALSFYLTNLVL
jgi:hypothetical protein